jgi:Icc-related predicted phosphoesterase
MASTVKLLTVTDLHCSKTLYQELARAIEQHRPEIVALVGDFLDSSEDHTGQFTNEECAEFLAALPCSEIVFIRGNHEEECWRDFAKAWATTGRTLHALHGEVFASGPLVLVGFPCFLGDETAYLGTREPLPSDPCEWLPDLLRAHGSALRMLWLTHEPPTGTPLTQTTGPMAGNPAWNEAIERFSPWLIISGHDHETPALNKCWYHRIEQTVCINVGQPDPKRLHYCLVEAEFARTESRMPTGLKATAYPLKRTVICR